MAKKPKAPKAGAPVSSWEKYDKAMTAYTAGEKKKESIKKKHSK